MIEKYSLWAKKTRQGTSRQKRNFSQEIGRAFSNQLFPGWSTKGMLEVGDTFSPRVPKEFTKDRVIGNSHTTLLLSVRDVCDFNGIWQDGDAVSFDQSQHDHVIWSAIDA